MRQIANGTILVVDDDMLSVEMCRHLLEAEGYTVHTATNGKEALGQVREEKPDLVLLDLYLNGFEGWDVLADIKKNSPDLPVLVVTGYDRNCNHCSVCVDFCPIKHLGECVRR